MKTLTFKRIIIRGCFVLFVISPFSCSELLLDHCGGLASALAAAETQLSQANTAENTALGNYVSAVAGVTLASAAVAAASAAYKACTDFFDEPECAGLKSVLDATRSTLDSASDLAVQASDDYDEARANTTTARANRDTAQNNYNACLQGPHTQSNSLQVKTNPNFLEQKKKGLEKLLKALEDDIQALQESKQKNSELIVALEAKRLDSSDAKTYIAVINKYLLTAKDRNDQTKKEYKEVVESIELLEKDLKMAK